MPTNFTRVTELQFRTRPTVILATLGFAASASAQVRTIRGVIRDTSDRPVTGVAIQVNGGPNTTTNDSGRFRIELPPRLKTTLEIHRLGFIPSRFSLGEGGDTTVEITLFPTVQNLPVVSIRDSAVSTKLRLTGFEERLNGARRSAHSAYFITEAEIDKRKPRDVTDLFHTLPSVKVVTVSTEQVLLYGNNLITDPKNPPRMVRCAITIYLDGQRLNSLADGGVEAPDINRIVSTDAIAGIEFYPSANRAPARFQSLNGGCGVALIWTK